MGSLADVNYDWQRAYSLSCVNDFFYLNMSNELLLCEAWGESFLSKEKQLMKVKNVKIILFSLTSVCSCSWLVIENGKRCFTFDVGRSIARLYSLVVQALWLRAVKQATTFQDSDCEQTWHDCRRTLQLLLELRASTFSTQQQVFFNTYKKWMNLYRTLEEHWGHGKGGWGEILDLFFAISAGM